MIKINYNSSKNNYIKNLDDKLVEPGLSQFMKSYPISDRGILYLRLGCTGMHPCEMGKYFRSVIAANWFTGPAYNPGLNGQNMLHLNAGIKHLMIIQILKDLWVYL